MSNFLLTSLIASVVLTLALNLLPALFPKAAVKAERRILERVQKTHENRVDPNTPKVSIFFPWKAMLLISVVLTVAVKRDTNGGPRGGDARMNGRALSAGNRVTQDAQLCRCLSGMDKAGEGLVR